MIEEKGQLDTLYDLGEERKKMQVMKEQGVVTEESFGWWLQDWNERCQQARNGEKVLTAQQEYDVLAKGSGVGVTIMDEEPLELFHEEKFVDMVNHPTHYANRRFEVIDVMEDTMTEEQFQGYLLGCAYKYLSRWDKKGTPEQDLKKARWYLDKLITRVEE
jgi:hypothetical protein